MFKPSLFALCVFSLTCWTCCAQENPYSIVISETTASDPEWSKVVTALQAKYPHAKTILWKQQVSETLDKLSTEHPRYTCFVAAADEVSRSFVSDVHRLTRGIDEDPYCDTLWGILTGYDAKNALRIASADKPLLIERVASGTEIALSKCKEGLWYDELVQHKTVQKTPDNKPTEKTGPADTTHALADSLSKYRSQLFITSGHATERNWQIGFRYKNGFFQSEGGKMFGRTTEGERFRIQSADPKVYLAVGNCLMGHIDGPDAMALAWMNDVGMNQMVGYTVLTWYGYSGWGILDYFVEQPGRYTLTEAFHANQHALIHRIDTYFPTLTKIKINAGSRNLPTSEPTDEGKSLGLTSFDSRGLLWDRDTVAFYGDPGWEAKMSNMPRAYEQKLTVEQDIYTFEITRNEAEKSFDPINTNGSQRGGRPIIHFLPNRVGEIELISGHELQPTISDDFILITNEKVKNHSGPIMLKFRASPAP